MQRIKNGIDRQFVFQKDKVKNQSWVLARGARV